MDSLKIGIIHMGFFYSGGGEKTVLNQAKHLEKMGHEVEIIAPIIDEDCFPELMKGKKSYEIGGWIPKILPIRAALAMISSSIITPIKKISENDVLIAHGQPSNWIAYRVSKQTETPYFSYLHQVNRFQKPRQIDIQSNWGPNSNVKVLKIINEKNQIIEYLDKKAIQCSNGVITNSHWIKKQILDYYRVDAKVCYPGIEKQDTKIQEKRDPVVLTTNRHFPQKRIDHFIGILKRVKTQIPEVKGKITGKFTEHTQSLIQKRDSSRLQDTISFSGMISESELVETYNRASVYCFTSPEEDLGLGPMEAGSYGLPSVVWDYAGPKETVIDNVTGYRVNPYNIDEMADQICGLLSDSGKRQKMGANAKKFSENSFSWDKHCEILQENILSVLID